MKLRIACLAATLLVWTAAAPAAQTVLCYSCTGPAGSSKCSFNGKEGTWGSPVTINGVTYQVCNIPSVAVIALDDAFVTDAQVQAHSQIINSKRRINPRTQDSDKHAQDPAEEARSIELREAEYKTVQHPEKKYYATILPDGLRVSFHTAQGHFGRYTFPHKEFPLGEPVFLLCPGSPELLPMRVVLIKGDNKNLNDYHDYKIEWLAESPATSDGARKVVRSY